MFLNLLVFSRLGIASPTLNAEAGRPYILGCPRWLRVHVHIQPDDDVLYRDSGDSPNVVFPPDPFQFMISNHLLIRCYEFEKSGMNKLIK